MPWRASALWVVLAAGTLAAAAGHQGPSEGQAARVRAVVQEVLAQPEFRAAREDNSRWRQWLAQQFQAVSNWLHDAFQRLPGWLAWLIVIWLLLTLVAILAHLVYVIAQQFSGGGGGRRKSSAQADLRTYGSGTLASDACLATARRYLAAGDWAAAVRHFYVAALLWLDQRGCVSFHESKTNYDYIRELAAPVGAREPLRDLTRTFDGVVYGGRVPTERTCHDMLTALEALQREVGAADKA